MFYLFLKRKLYFNEQRNYQNIYFAEIEKSMHKRQEYQI